MFEHLEDMVIVNNDIGGTLPETSGSTMSKLTMLDLHGNRFTGTIPGSFLSSSPLEAILLGGNEFIGSVPKDAGRWRDAMAAIQRRAALRR